MLPCLSMTNVFAQRTTTQFVFVFLPKKQTKQKPSAKCAWNILLVIWKKMLFQADKWTLPLLWLCALEGTHYSPTPLKFNENILECKAWKTHFWMAAHLISPKFLNNSQVFTVYLWLKWHDFKMKIMKNHVMLKTYHHFFPREVINIVLVKQRICQHCS